MGRRDGEGEGRDKRGETNATPIPMKNAVPKSVMRMMKRRGPVFVSFRFLLCFGGQGEYLLEVGPAEAFETVCCGIWVDVVVAVTVGADAVAVTIVVVSLPPRSRAGICGISRRTSISLQLEGEGLGLRDVEFEGTFLRNSRFGVLVLFRGAATRFFRGVGLCNRGRARFVAKRLDRLAPPFLLYRYHALEICDGRSS